MFHRVSNLNNLSTMNAMQENTVSEPLSLIGAGVLGAIAQWAVRKAFRVFRPGGPNGSRNQQDKLDQISADITSLRGEVRKDLDQLSGNVARLQGEMRQIVQRLGELEGTVSGIRCVGASCRYGADGD